MEAAYGDWERKVDDLTKYVQLTEQQLDMLAVIQQHPDKAVHEIARILDVDARAVARPVQGLAKKGLARGYKASGLWGKDSPFRYRLTAAGQEYLRQLEER